MSETVETRGTESAKTQTERIVEELVNIRKDSEYLQAAIKKIGEIPSGGGDVQYAPGDIAGEAKAKAVLAIVQAREETNRQLIGFYQKMYDQLTAERL